MITCHNNTPQVRKFFHLLNRSGLSTLPYAAKVGVNATTIFAWARGRRNPSLTNLEASLNALGYTLTITTLLEPENGKK